MRKTFTRAGVQFSLILSLSVIFLLYQNWIPYTQSTSVNPCTNKPDTQGVLDLSYIKIFNAQDFNNQFLNNAELRVTYFDAYGNPIRDSYTSLDQILQEKMTAANLMRSGQISDYRIIQAVRDKKFVLCQDINFQGQQVLTKDLSLSGVVLHGTEHTMTFDQNSIKAPASGMFGAILDGSTVMQLKILGIDVQDTELVGALTGYLINSSVHNVKIQNAKIITKSAANSTNPYGLDSFAGGVAAICQFSDIQDVRILNSQIGFEGNKDYGSMATVSIGGACGQAVVTRLLRVSSVIMKSFDLDTFGSQFTLPGKIRDFVGGLVGRGYGLRILQSSVNTSYLKGACQLGGLVGALEPHDSGYAGAGIPVVPTKIFNSYVTQGELLWFNKACALSGQRKGVANIVGNLLTVPGEDLAAQSLPLSQRPKYINLVHDNLKIANVYSANYIADINLSDENEMNRSCFANHLLADPTKTIIQNSLFSNQNCPFGPGYFANKTVMPSTNPASLMLRPELSMKDLTQQKTVYPNWRFTQRLAADGVTLLPPIWSQNDFSLGGLPRLFWETKIVD